MTRPAATILVVDDEPANRKLLQALLAPEGYVVRTAASGREALDLVARQPPDLVLLDVMMPELDGYAVAAALKADPSTARIPVIMVSALCDRDTRLSGLHAGAEDFLAKPVDRAELWLRVRNLLRLKEISDALREQGLALEQQVTARTADLHQLAHFDPLTGLPNRGMFQAELVRTIAHAPADADVVVLFVDVDRFKVINDTWGHGVGDELLRQFGQRLARCVRTGDTVGRIGGDEFALIVVTAKGGDGASTVAKTILGALDAPFDLGVQTVAVSASIGIGLHHAAGGTGHRPGAAASLLQCADTAMYSAKEAGRGTFRFFTPQMGDDVNERTGLEADLRVAVREGQFVLHYQPKVRLVDGQVCGTEALIRWDRPGLGLVPPDLFIPALESTGLIVAVGRWVIDEACRQLRVWRDSDLGAVPVSVNVSGRQFAQGSVYDDVAESLQRHGVPAHLLELELTESLLMSDTDHTIATLHALKSLGVRLSVDDFGTGYSSLAYLRRFPIDTLKIDRAFVKDVTTDPDDAAIALTIIRMAHTLKLDVVAEGVETAGQLEYLRRQHCDMMQGYHFSRPLPVAALDDLRLAGTRLDVDDEPSRRETVLLYAAAPVALTELGGVLVGDGYLVLQSSDVPTALELLARHSVQVLVCHQPTAVNGGQDLIDVVRQLHPETLRFVVAGSSDTRSLTHAINGSAIHRYYTDPWDPAVLRDDVRDAVRHYWLQASRTQAPDAETATGRPALRSLSGG
ncbi:MAG: EAL domain-containing protein [Actinomycetota bacterium]